MRAICSSVVVSALAAGAVCDRALAGLIQALYTSVAAGAGSSDVPGGGGIRFVSFDRPARSPDGTRWLMLARTDSGNTANDAIFFAGQGPTGTMILREGVTEIEPGRTAENMSERRCAITDAGDAAMTINLTGATTDDSTITVVSGSGSPSVRLREGQAVAAIPGASYGVTLTDPTFDSLGRVAVRAVSLAGTGTGMGSAVLLADGTVLAAQIANAATRPTGQLGAENWSAFDLGNVYTDAGGSRWLARGSLSGSAASNVVLAVDNVVRIQESVTLPGQASPVLTILGANMTSNGDWFARGENADDSAWIVRSGIVEFDSDDAVPGGDPGETFTNTIWNVSNGNTFFEHTGNNFGDWIVGGFTNAPTARYAVWVLNGQRVVIRRGDPIDLDGNGLADDNAVVDVTGLTGASLNNKVTGGVLADDGWFYFITDVSEPNLAPRGEAFVRVRVFCPADTNRNGETTVQDIFDFLAAYFASEARGDFNRAGGITVQDIFDFLAAYFAGCE